STARTAACALVRVRKGVAVLEPSLLSLPLGETKKFTGAGAACAGVASSAGKPRPRTAAAEVRGVLMRLVLVRAGLIPVTGVFSSASVDRVHAPQHRAVGGHGDLPGGRRRGGGLVCPHVPLLVGRVGTEADLARGGGDRGGGTGLVEERHRDVAVGQLLGQ